MKKLYLVVGVLLLVSILGCAKANRKILLIFSYHPEYAWVIEETKGVESVLSKRGIETEKFYLDTKRHTSAEWKLKVTEDAIKKIEELKPSLVIVFDDNACELVAKKYIGKALPFVFCGMNADPKEYGFPAKNITGVIERHHIVESIEFLQQLVPNVKKIALITDDSFTSKAFVIRVKKTILPVEMYECDTTNDFGIWKAKIKQFQYKVDAIGLVLYHTIKTKGSEISLLSEDVLRWTLENNKLPEFAVNSLTVKNGALCGVTLSGYQQGKSAAEMALTILAGATPGNIPIVCPAKGKPMVNAKRADALNITIPEDVLKEVQVIY